MSEIRIPLSDKKPQNEKPVESEKHELKIGKALSNEDVAANFAAGVMRGLKTSEEKNALSLYLKESLNKPTLFSAGCEKGLSFALEKGIERVLENVNAGKQKSWKEARFDKLNDLSSGTNKGVFINLGDKLIPDSASVRAIFEKAWDNGASFATEGFVDTNGKIGVFAGLKIPLK